jgi:hypothetical protein
MALQPREQPYSRKTTQKFDSDIQELRVYMYHLYYISKNYRRNKFQVCYACIYFDVNCAKNIFLLIALPYDRELKAAYWTGLHVSC